VDLDIHSSIRLHGVALSSLSNGTTLPFLPLPLRFRFMKFFVSNQIGDMKNNIDLLQ
jgi:hypothetical protein